MESVYEEVLFYRLTKRSLFVSRQQGIPVFFEDTKKGIGFRADLVVENRVIVELKSQEIAPPVHYRKVVTYLKLSKIKVGLLINFYQEVLVKGIKRLVYKF